MKKQLTLLILSTSFLLVSCDTEANNHSSTQPLSESSVQSDSDIHVSSLSITNGSTTMKIGETLELKIDILPANSTNTLINYKSSDSSVASVDFNGKVVARSTGVCTIEAISDDNPNIKDEITITVIEGEETFLDVKFPSNVEIVKTTNNTFYKLITGSSYLLDISFSDEAEKELGYEFSLEGYASFDTETKTIQALSRIDSLSFSLYIKGTTTKKTFNLKIINEGENDVEEVVAKLKKSKTLENNKYVNQYKTHYVFDTVDINYSNHYINDQEITYDVYENGTDNYMFGQGRLLVTTDSKTIDKNIISYKGMDTNAYYDYMVDTDGNHLKVPSKKDISDSNKDEIKKKSTLITDNNLHYGLSDIALFQIGGAGAYENSFGTNGGYTIGSIPIYFGGNNLKNDVFVTKGNTISVDTYCIDELPSSQMNGKVFYNHGEYTFDEEGILLSLKVSSKQYDEESFDFKTSTLKENPKAVRSYQIELSQSFGDYHERVNNDYLPNNLYFTDFTPVFLNKKGEQVNKFSSGEKYYLSFEKPLPSIATDYIDFLAITKTTSKEIATISESGTEVTFNKSGEVTLTIYSDKNKVKKEVVINVDEVLPTSLTIKANSNEIGDSLDMEVGEEVVFSCSLEPLSSTSKVTSSISSGTGELTQNSDNTYTFKSTTAGDVTLSFTAGEIKKEVLIHVKEATSKESLIDKMLKKTYTCEEIDEEHSLKIKSASEAQFEIDDGMFKYIVSLNIEINEEKKTIRFTSFDVTNEEYDTYIDSYLPVIKQNIDYKINDENSFSVKLICDLGNGKEENYSNSEDYVFVAK